jgi:hypothetical protein
MVGDLPQTNMGAFVLLSQLSILAVPFVVGFVWLTYRSLIQARFLTDPVLRCALTCGVVMPPFIGAVDVLWFVPTLWAPMILCDGLYWELRRVTANNASGIGL